MTPPYFLGIDIGTQGARVILVAADGRVVATEGETFLLTDQSREEQSPQVWWNSCLASLQRLIGKAILLIDVKAIKAVSVTSTSGTVIPIDTAHRPLHPAIMYSDQRSAEEGVICRAAAVKYNNRGYIGFNSSSGLSKMVWYVRHFPEEAQKIDKWIHAADYITGKLSGSWGITDYTNALKSGYDLHGYCWPAYLYQHLPLQQGWLPEVVSPGTPVGTLDEQLAEQLGLEKTIIVVAGMTDGCASQVASGAVHPGEWNTTIGTTMVVKGVTINEIKDEQDRLYCHRHPEGYWMPGGASNIGADWVSQDFSEQLEELTEQAANLVPTGKIAYPLLQQGERFPFIAPQARGFQEPGLSREVAFAANMEGVAYVERYAYEMIEKLCGESVQAVFTAGGGSNSDVWLRIRSNVLNRPLYKMRHVEGAVGAAILAASKTHYNTIGEAAKAMSQIEKAVYPQGEAVKNYEHTYRRFLETLNKKGYIK